MSLGVPANWTLHHSFRMEQRLPETVTIFWRGAPISAKIDHTVAAALLDAGVMSFRIDYSGQPRGPICGMGSCMECRADVDGTPYQRTCLLMVRDGMHIEPADGT